MTWYDGWSIGGDGRKDVHQRQLKRRFSDACAAIDRRDATTAEQQKTIDALRAGRDVMERELKKLRGVNDRYIRLGRDYSDRMEEWSDAIDLAKRAVEARDRVLVGNARLWGLWRRREYWKRTARQHAATAREWREAARAWEATADGYAAAGVHIRGKTQVEMPTSYTDCITCVDRNTNRNREPCWSCCAEYQRSGERPAWMKGPLAPKADR